MIGGEGSKWFTLEFRNEGEEDIHTIQIVLDGKWKANASDLPETESEDLHDLRNFIEGGAGAVLSSPPPNRSGTLPVGVVLKLNFSHDTNSHLAFQNVDNEPYPRDRTPSEIRVHDKNKSNVWKITDF
jgi:hypothetical protein